MKDPYDLIKEAGLKPEDLGEQGEKVLATYDNAAEMRKKRPKDPTVKETTEKIFTKVEAAITKLVHTVVEQQKQEADKQADERLKKENSKLTMAEINAELKELEECDTRLKVLKRSKREKEGKKPKTKTRYTKLKEKLLGVATLLPDKLKNDLGTIGKTESILLHTHRELVKAWGMNKVKAKSGEKAITEKFDVLQDKANEEFKKEKSK